MENGFVLFVSTIQNGPGAPLHRICPVDYPLSTVVVVFVVFSVRVRVDIFCLRRPETGSSAVNQ